MGNEENVKKNLEIAISYQEKYDFYIVSLVFTVLALSVQTSHVEGNVLIKISELVAWIALLFSGISGLSMLRNARFLYKLIAMKFKYENKEDSLKELQLKGVNEIYILEDSKDHPIEEQLKFAGDSVSKIEKKLKEEQNKNNKRYRIQNIFMIIGFSFLIIARGLFPLYFK